MNEINKSTLVTSVRSVLNNAGFTDPFDLDAEKSVIYMMLYNNRALEYAIETLNCESFYNRDCRDFYKEFQRLYLESDRMLTTQDLQNLIINNKRLYIKLLKNIQLVNHDVFISQVETIKENHIRRKAIHCAICLLEDAFDTLTSAAKVEYAAETLSKSFWLTSSKYNKDIEYHQLSELLTDTLEEILWQQNHDQLRGIPSGYERLDKETSGWRDGDLILIVAQPAIGLETFALTMASNAAVDHNIPIAYCSTTKSPKEITMRLISCVAGISKDQLMGTGQLNNNDWQSIEDKARRLCKAPLHILSISSHSLDHLHFTIRRLVEEHNVKAIYIENIDTIYRETIHEDLNITITLQFLKTIARKLNISIIVLHTLHNLNYPISETTPSICTLREQGISDKWADEIIFLHRTNYDNLTENPEDIGLTKITIAKNTHGGLNEFYLKFNYDTLQFEDLNY